MGSHEVEEESDELTVLESLHDGFRRHILVVSKFYSKSLQGAYVQAEIDSS